MNMGTNYDLSDKKVNADYLETQKRKCHDCGRPTWNYRCRECLAKHHKKHGVTETATDHGEA